jgi:hypothetical protein
MTDAAGVTSNGFSFGLAALGGYDWWRGAEAERAG